MGSALGALAGRPEGEGEPDVGRSVHAVAVGVVHIGRLVVGGALMVDAAPALGKRMRGWPPAPW